MRSPAADRRVRQRYGESVSSQPRCPHCRHFLYLDTLTCPNCEAELGYHILTRQFYGVRNNQVVIDERTWYTCSNRDWECNWLVREDAPAGRCFSCRLTRTRPAANDTVALEKLAEHRGGQAPAAPSARRASACRSSAWDVKPGGLGFDLLSSLTDGKRVMIGHANGIITIDLAESLDDRREALRVRLGEPYRTILGHLRHEVGHYYQNVLLTDDADWDRCRELFGDERASYRDAIKRHYAFGAPDGLARVVHLGVRHDAPVGGLRRDLRALPAHHRHAADGRGHRHPSRCDRDQPARHRCRPARVVRGPSRSSSC